MALTPSDAQRRRARKLLRKPFSQSSASLPGKAKDSARLHLVPLEDRVTPAITGTVFQDYNANGVFDINRTIPNAALGSVSVATDRGVAGVTVAAFDANNTVVAAAVTNSAGEYSLDTLGVGPFRVEFSNLPAGYFFGPTGVTQNTAIQFVNTNAQDNVNLAITRAEDYSSDNPLLVSSSYVFGGIAPNDQFRDLPVIVSSPYSSGSADSDPSRLNHRNPTTHALSIPQFQVGSTWGLAYDRTTNQIYASAFMKRHAGFGPIGPGGIYTTPSTGNNATPFVDLNSVFGDFPAGNLNQLFTNNAGQPVSFRTPAEINIADTHDYWLFDGLTRVTDNAGVARDVGWDAVGKISLGGLAFDGSANKLYTVALGDRRLYSVPTTGALNSSTIQRFDLPIPSTVTGRTAANPLGDLRPFAAEYYRGLIYVGAVNSAESTQRKSDLRAYVFTFDPAKGTFVNRNRQTTTSESVLEFRLDYTRGFAYRGGEPTVNQNAPPYSAAWNPWSPTYQSVAQQPFAEGRTVYPQPMLTGLAFDAAGNVSIGIRDRLGDQVGYIAPANPADPLNFQYLAMSAGDTLRAFINTPGNLDVAERIPTASLSGWTLESNGRNPDLSLGTGPQFNGQGPGGGEFYFNDELPRDPSQPPVGILDEHQELSLGGIAQIPGFPDLVSTTYDPVRQPGAVNGGGFRWYSTTTGAIQKSYEVYVTPISGGSGSFAKANGLGDLVAVAGQSPIELGDRLWLDLNENGIQDAGEPGIAGAQIQLHNGAGDLVASAITDASGYYLFSSSTTSNSSASRIFGLNLLPNANYQIRMLLSQSVLGTRSLTIANADASPGGTQRDSDAVAIGNFGIINVNTGANPASNRNLDIGIRPLSLLSIGDLVWSDLNNDGLRGVSEPGIDGVPVNLYAANGTTLLATTITQNGGRYQFQNLDPGTYIVEIVPPAGFVSSTGQNGSTAGPFEPGITQNIDDADHGTQTGTSVRTAAFTLFPAGDSRNPDTNGARPNNANFRQDFGLIRPLSIGDTVWFDLNNDGIRNASEPGIGNVTLNLRNASDAIVASAVTNSAGGYLFTNLIPGQYRVEVVRATLPLADLISSTGANGTLSGPFEPAPGNTVDGTDYGTTNGPVVTGPLISLNFGTAPVDEGPVPGGIVDPAANSDSNRRQDFGFFRPLSIGNFVWDDVNNNGVFDAGTDAPLPGVTVQLLNNSGTILASTQTNSSGNYQFPNLIPGTYQVRLVPPAGYISSTGRNGSLTSGPFEPGLSDNTDSADHGTTVGAFVVASPITLAIPGSASNPDNNGTANLRQDFGLFRPLSIGDFVWDDANNNGKFDTSESPLSGVLVFLIDGSGATVANTTTNSSGNYQFTGLIPGSYLVRIAPPTGYRSSTGTPGSFTGPYEPGVSGNQNNEDHGTQAGAFVESKLVLSNPGANPDNNGLANLRQDFGLFRPLSVGNLVWDDLNNNGKFDAGELGLPNVRVDLLDANGSIFATTFTSPTGSYSFTNLAQGTYSIRIQAPEGYRSSTGTVGSLTGPYEPGDTGIADNEDRGTQGPGSFVSAAPFTLGISGSPANPDLNGTANLRQDFGLFRPLSIGDFVWDDRNNSGLFDAGDLPLDGVTVQLLDANGVQIAATSTANGGKYLFSNLSPGKYQVQLIPPAGFISSTGAPGNSKSGPFEPGVVGNQNNADHGTQSGSIVIAAPTTLGLPGDASTNPDDAGLSNLRQDFGLFRALTVGNLVWNDLNNNGRRDDSEPGIPGVSVDLLNESGNVVATTTTDASGLYLFTNLSSGVYSVRITSPTGFVSSTGKNGSLTGPYEPGVSGTQDNEDHGTTIGAFIIASPFTLAQIGDPLNPDNNGSANLRQDFGLFQPLSIGNLVFDDPNNNGKRDAGEAGLSGVPVFLIDADSGTTIAETTTASSGIYNFVNLVPGRYIVEIIAPDGKRSSSGIPNAASGPFEPVLSDNGNDDEDKGTQTGNRIRTNVVILGLPGSPLNPDSAGLANLRQDFGIAPPIEVPPPPPPPAIVPASVSGFVYRDINTINGQREPANRETGIPGTTITLTGVDRNGNAIPSRTTITDVNGFYQFLNLVPGTYTIVETQPQGFLDGIDTPGSLGGANSSNDLLTVTLNEGQNGVEYNFGEILPSGVFGFVYEDVNRNRRRDPGEPGIPSTTVTLSGTVFDGTPLARPLQPSDSIVGLSVQTDATGRYEFPFLPPGTYTITQTQPAGFSDFFESVQEPFTRPVVVGNDVFSGVVAAPAETRGPLNFGEVRAFAVVGDDPTKRNFLGSSPSTGQVTVPPTITPPIVVGPTDLPTNPPFQVSTGDPSMPSLLVVSASAGRSPLVRVFDYATSTEKYRFYAYETSFTGGVRATTGDVDGDGIPDIITATGIGGGPRVRVFSGKDGSVLRDFFAYEDTFRGGVFVAAADIDGDGKADIITGTEIGGGPRVTIRSGATNQVIQDFFAFDPNQRGGVRIAAADFTGDGRADIVVATGAGVPTRVRVFDGRSQAMLTDFVPYTPNFTGGVFVAAGAVFPGSAADIITSADVGGGPHVQIFRGLSGQSGNAFFAYDQSFTGGARISTADVNGDGLVEIVTAPGSGSTPQIKIWNGLTAQVVESFGAFDSTTDSGVYVG